MLDALLTRLHTRTHPRLIMAGAGILVILCLLFAILFWGHRKGQSALQHDFRVAQQTAAFPLYLPSNLPDGYTYDNGSLRSTSDVVVYTVTGPDSKQLAITEQSKPASFDFSQLSGTQEFTTSLGKAYVEDFQTRTTGSVVGDKTWVIINAPTPIGSDQMDLLLKSFQALQ